jgi:hypothetical protein
MKRRAFLTLPGAASASPLATAGETRNQKL